MKVTYVARGEDGSANSTMTEGEMISGTHGVSAAVAQWQAMGQSPEGRSTAGASAPTPDARLQALAAQLPIRYSQTVSDICSHIVGAIHRVGTLDPEIGNEMVVPAYMDDTQRARLMQVVEASLSLELPHARFPIGERLTARTLMSLRRDEVRARLNPDLMWLADGLAEIGERKMAALLASETAPPPEPTGWVSFGEDVFGPEVEEAFAEPEPEAGFFDWLGDESVTEVLHRFVLDVGFVISAALQKFRWAGSGVDPSRGIDYERVARLAPPRPDPSRPSDGPEIPLIEGSSAPLHRALMVAGSTDIATAPSTLWLNTCYPSLT
ncbi:hypothetical protein ACPWR0_05310 [Pandoraea pneumonica]|uniref:hypothetical protein n=1 Tax=Pandoraea pneumonica TaxID=2508299 RepID=UPI003CFB2256